MFGGTSGHTAQNLAVAGREDLSRFGGLDSIGADDYQVVFAPGDLQRGVSDRDNLKCRRSFGTKRLGPSVAYVHLRRRLTGRKGDGRGRATAG